MLHQNILVGVSLLATEGQPEEQLSPDSQQAVTRAIELAGRHGGRVTFAHTFAVSHRVREFFTSQQTEDQDSFESARPVMKGLVDRAKEYGVDAHWVFLYGKPWEEIRRYVEENEIDLVVVGTSQPKGVKRTFFGSTAQRVMMETPCPVLVAHGETDAPYKRILVATDNSHRGALRHGMAYGRDVDSEVHAVHGVENWYEDRWHRAGLVRHIVEKEHEDAMQTVRDDLESRARSLAEELQTEVPVVHVASGRPEAVIWETVEELQPDLVVLGYVGRTGLQGFFVGDTAHRLLPELPCSLLTVPATSAPPTQ